MPERFSHPELEAILQQLHRLEKRINRVETALGLHPVEEEDSPEARTFPAELPAAVAGETELEMRIGEFGLAWAGGIAFLLGIVFLMTYTLNQGHSLLSAAIGYSSAAGLFFLSRAWKKVFPYLSKLLIWATLLLTYYATMRLHYFTASPLIGNSPAVLALLLTVILSQGALAVVRRSQALAAIALLLGMFTALLSDTTHVMLALAAVFSAIAVSFALRLGWWRLVNLAIVLTYGTHMLWLVGNPVAGHALHPVEAHWLHLGYLFLCAAVLAWPALSFDESAQIDLARMASVFLNCMGFIGIVSVAVLAVFPKIYGAVFLAASALLLTCSIAQWLKTRLQLAPAVYACFGYLALSVAIYGFAHVLEAFLWLALESFLVVSMALWFRSKALVVANAFIFLGILLAYWLTAPLSVPINFSFALVALGSARVMNWQKERLTLRTDVLRNVYLGITFILILYSLYHAVPPSYVALSWTLVSVVYFFLSQLLKNVKYRWMSLLNLLATVLYLFLVDLPSLDPRFRVVSFLFLGFMAVGISLFYARLRRRARRQGTEN